MYKLLILGIISIFSISLVMESCSDNDNGSSSQKTDGKGGNTPGPESDGAVLTEAGGNIIVDDAGQVINEAGYRPEASTNPNEAGATNEAGNPQDVGTGMSTCKLIYECQFACQNFRDYVCLKSCESNGCSSAKTAILNLQTCQKDQCNDECDLDSLGSAGCKTCTSSNCSSELNVCQNNQC